MFLLSTPMVLKKLNRRISCFSKNCTLFVPLVEEGWLDLESALGLAEPIMCGNARALFNLDRKTRRLQAAPWV